ncbi:MAG: flavin reductase family protein [Actinomycetota bacterium]|nr:flavin reductase family protein [Acidimicrobiia bacterium]MDQ3146080.1 flavin reductase family protein [Actinomycetota bacterium]
MVDLPADEPGGAGFDSAHFRTVLGHFPTGVVVVTAVGAGGPVGMAVGSFTSVSLDPPLVAFCPDLRSTTWPTIREVRLFCANVLSEDQEDVCRVFATKGGDKFAGVGWHPASTGSPRLTGVLAWIDCEIDTVHDAGDHQICVGKVRELGVERAGGPLVFYRGGYGSFES